MLNKVMKLLVLLVSASLIFISVSALPEAENEIEAFANQVVLNEGEQLS